MLHALHALFGAAECATQLLPSQTDTRTVALCYTFALHYVPFGLRESCGAAGKCLLATPARLLALAASRSPPSRARCPPDRHRTSTFATTTNRQTAKQRNCTRGGLYGQELKRARSLASGQTRQPEPAATGKAKFGSSGLSSTQFWTAARGKHSTTPIIVKVVLYSLRASTPQSA